jgi:hypothetical protein
VTAIRIELEQRVTDLLGSYDVHPEERRRILSAYDAAQRFEDLPPDILELAAEIEKRPRQSWDDPYDVPDNLDELD